MESNNLGDVGELVRIHAATEYWVAAIGWWPGVPFMMPLDPRCRLTAPRYNPPRLWTKKGTVGVGGGTTGIYPEDLPGGIQIFGRIPVPIWDRDRRFPDLRGLDLPAAPRRSREVRALPRSTSSRRSSAWWTRPPIPSTSSGTRRFSVPRYRAWLKTIDAEQRF